MGTDFIKILEDIRQAVSIAMGLLSQGPAAFELAMKILDMIKTDPDKLDMEKIHAELDALQPLPYKEE